MDERVFEFTRAGDCSHDSRQFSEIFCEQPDRFAEARPL
jgi:hypothetical protein